jgi:hypothetical protein
MLRSNNYDGLSITIHSLRKTFNEHENALLKADVNDTDSLQKCVDVYEDVNELCKSVYNQYLFMKGDFQSGKINQAHYVNKLSEIRDLLTQRENKIVNKFLHTDELVTEIKRFFH